MLWKFKLKKVIVSKRDKGIDMIPDDYKCSF